MAEISSDKEQDGPKPKRQKTTYPEPNSSRYIAWTSDEMHNFFQLRGIDNSRKIFEVIGESDAHGKDLDSLVAKDKFSLDADVDLYRRAEEIQHLLKSLQQLQYMVYQDSIHGPIELHPLIAKIIDTPELQRLRRIMQLGGGCYIFSGATHTRFEHSIGVCYVAGELVQHLDRKQPELGIEEKDVLCVQIAGLCHDLGHGPFSHMFESYFMKKFPSATKWRHEEISAKLFHRLYKRMKGDFSHYGFNETDCEFIKEQIEGCDPSSKDIEGRPKKRFLYEIVANRRNGIDVDKWDYFARDCHHMGLSNNFQWRRAMLMSRVIKVESGDLVSLSQPTSSQTTADGWQICMRDKEIENVYDMFHTRHTLRRQAYFHKTKSIVERMIAEALLMVKDVPIIPIHHDGRDPEFLSITEAVESALRSDNPDMMGFLSLTDDIIHQILNYSAGPHKTEVTTSQSLLKRVLDRKVYKYIGVVPARKNSKILEKSPQDLARDIFPEGCHVEIIPFSHGFEREQNPVNDVHFYSKTRPWYPIRISDTKVSPLVIPKEFAETEIRVYDKRSDTDDHGDLECAFKQWAQENKEDLGLEKLQLDDGKYTWCTDETTGIESRYISPLARKESSSGSGTASGDLAPKKLDFPE